MLLDRIFAGLGKRGVGLWKAAAETSPKVWRMSDERSSGMKQLGAVLGWWICYWEDASLREVKRVRLARCVDTASRHS